MRDLRRVLEIYVAAAKSASRGLFSNLLILLFSALAYVVLALATGLFGQFGMAGGMLLGFIQIALLTYFYSWIALILQRDKITFQNFYEFDYALFFSLISVAFIIFIAQYLVQSSIQGLNAGLIMLFLNLGIVFLFNAIPEVIVVHRYESVSALTYALQFARDNFIAWFVPLLIMVAPILALSPESALVFFAKSDPMLPAMLVFKALSSAFGVSPIYDIALPLAIVGAVWCTLFRMQLFKLLDGSAR